MSSVIFITGASSGIGKAATEKLASQGHRLIITARRKDKLDALKAKWGDLVFPIALDVKDSSAVKAAVDAGVAHFGGLDVLVNNAGMGYFDPFDNGSIEQWDNMIDTNIKGLLYCIHAALPHLVESKGQIVNLGSVASHQVFANSGVYCATKHAVWAISESIRTELAAKVRVTTISPGAVNTEFVDQTTNADLLKDYKPYFAAGMTAEHIAEQIAWSINAPKDTVITEIIIRPNKQPI
jgi:NADP-dependent 3-hydroxy acid dehydrogenase YdfG